MASAYRNISGTTDNYRVDRLIGDALDIFTAIGYRERRFSSRRLQLGGSLAWLITDRP